MKLVVCVCAGLLCGCGSLREAYLSAREKHAIGAALASMNPKTVARPAITMTTRFAGVCPYCGEINLSISTASSGSSTISIITSTNEPAQTLTNVLKQSWTISFRCRNCLMFFSDYRDQLVPDTKTVQLPLFGQ